jgi:hypothetical protein
MGKLVLRNMIDRVWAALAFYTVLTISNSSRTNFSDSPRYLEVRVEEETLKNVVPHSVATALANMVFPVPGGPTISTPFHGRRMPCKCSVPLQPDIMSTNFQQDMERPNEQVSLLYVLETKNTSIPSKYQYTFSVGCHSYTWP